MVCGAAAFGGGGASGWSLALPIASRAGGLGSEPTGLVFVTLTRRGASGAGAGWPTDFFPSSFSWRVALLCAGPEAVVCSSCFCVAAVLSEGPGEYQSEE